MFALVARERAIAFSQNQGWLSGDGRAGAAAKGSPAP